METIAYTWENKTASELTDNEVKEMVQLATKNGLNALPSKLYSDWLALQISNNKAEFKNNQYAIKVPGTDTYVIVNKSAYESYKDGSTVAMDISNVGPSSTVSFGKTGEKETAQSLTQERIQDLYNHVTGGTASEEETKLYQEWLAYKINLALGQGTIEESNNNYVVQIPGLNKYANVPIDSYRQYKEDSSKGLTATYEEKSYEAKNAQYPWEHKKPANLTYPELASIHSLVRTNAATDSQAQLLYDWMKLQLNEYTEKANSSEYTTDGTTNYAKLNKDSDYVTYNTTTKEYEISIPGTVSKYYIRNAELSQFVTGDDKTKVRSATGAENMGLLDAEHAYMILMASTQSPANMAAAVNYYKNHKAEMDAAYPDLAEAYGDQVPVGSASEVDGITSEIRETEGSVINNDINPLLVEAQYYLGNTDRNLVDEDIFQLPDMGDFYIGNVDDTLLKIIDKKINDKLKAKKGNSKDTATDTNPDPEKACYYTENKPFKELGYDPSRNLYYLQANVNITQDDIDRGLVDGNHITIRVDSLEGDPEGIAVNRLKEILKNRTDKYEYLKDKDAAKYLTLELVGVTAPKVPKWAYEYGVPIANVQFEKRTIKDASAYGNHIYINNINDESTELNFVHISGKWRQCDMISTVSPATGGEERLYASFRWLMDPGDDGIIGSGGKEVTEGDLTSHTDGYNENEAARTAAETLQMFVNDNAKGKIYIVLEGDSINGGSKVAPATMSSTLNDAGFFGQVNNMASTCPDKDLLYCGLNRIDMDANRRFYAAVYYNEGDVSRDVYVNLAKLMIRQGEEAGALKGVKSNADKYEGANGDYFDNTGYDMDARTYADAFFESLSELDDRAAVQKKLFGKSWEALHNWTVTLGDLTFFVPPENINIVTTTSSERLPLIRAHGTMAKTDQRMDKYIWIEVYFNEARGINGKEYDVTLPNGSKVTYAMNGLRVLMSQFRFTPFLPITNHYINQVLGIDAVQLEQLEIESVPMYPKLIKVKLGMTQFKWQVFMPDIAQLAVEGYTRDDQNLKANNYDNVEADDYEDVPTVNDQVDYINSLPYRNWFALSFNWPVYRYYIQRPIRRGSYLRSIGWDFNSDNYIQYTSGYKTSYVPMIFRDPTIKFYMASEEYIRKVYKARFEFLNKVNPSSGTGISFNDRQNEFLTNMKSIYDKIKETTGSDEWQQNMTKLNSNLANAIRENNKVGGNVGSSFIAVAMDAIGGIVNGTYSTKEGFYDGFSNTFGSLGSYIDESGKQSLNHMIYMLQNSVEQTIDPAYISDYQYRMYWKDAGEDTKKLQFCVDVRLKPGYLSDVDKQGLQSSVASLAGMSADDVLAGDTISIPLSLTLHDGFLWAYDATGDDMFELDENDPGMKLLSTASKYAGRQDKDADIEVVPDVRALMNLKFDPYDVGTARVATWSASTHNTFAKLRALNNDLAASQYMGGGDTRVTVLIETTSEETVAKLKALPEEITRLTRQYHMVMPCTPLRVDSEFTRLLGCNEFTVEELVVLTVNHEDGRFPGLFRVQLELMSVDRTLRNKEAAERVSDHSDGQVLMNTDPSRFNVRYGDEGVLGLTFLPEDISVSWDEGIRITAAKAPGVNGELGRFFNNDSSGSNFWRDCWDYGPFDSYYLHTKRSNWGSGVEQTKKINGFFEAKDMLGNCDLYPDLELPTLDQMEDIGFYFMRYKFQDERKYVDPDFYMVYPVALTSQFYRELAINSVSAGLLDTTLTDSSGAQVKITPDFGQGFKIEEENEIYKNQRKTYRDLMNLRQQLEESKKNDSKENLKDKVKRGNVLDLALKLRELESWKICADIESRFLEQDYLKEYESWLAKQDSETATDAMKSTEGKFVSNSLTDSKDGVRMILEYLKNTPVETDITSIYNEYAQKIGSGEKSLEEAMKSLDTSALKLSEETAKDILTHKDQHTSEEIVAAQKRLSYGFDRRINSLSSTDLYAASITTAQQRKALSLNAATGDISRVDVSHTSLQNAIFNKAQSFIYDNATMKAALEKMHIEFSTKFTSTFSNIVYAAACALTGEKEYSGNTNADEWRPSLRYIGTKMGGTQDASGLDALDSTDAGAVWKIVKTGIRFGFFDFKMYTRANLSSIINEIVEAKTKEEDIEKGNVNGSYYLMDPYYRQAGTKIADVEKYKIGCICSPDFATEAFCRLIMYWLCKLVDANVFPTIASDVLRDPAKLEVEIQAKQQEVMGTVQHNYLTDSATGTVTDLNNLIQFFSTQAYAVDAGKMWAATVLAVSDGNNSIFNRMKQRDYKGLNAFIDSVGSASLTVNSKNEGPMAIRKMIRALVGMKVINDFNAIGITPTDPAVNHRRNYIQSKYLSCAEDPKSYIPHSFHDMIVNDARGRLLRAFPTYYLCLVDEGRQIGSWKLHDNFYNTSSIAQINIVKSRKIPADTATITMSNFYNSYTTEQEDYISTAYASWDDALDSIFSPAEYFKKVEARTRNKPQEVKLRLRPGARIHIRMGYGNNAGMLPVLFNGVITDVSAEATVDIIAQGDGRELTNPILQDTEAHQIEHQDDLMPGSMDNSSTVLEICNGLFNTYGGFLNEQLRKRLGLTFMGERNPYGIVHFGDPDFTTLFKQGETLQNIYEASSKPFNAGSEDIINSTYPTDMVDTPKITFNIFQKTPWDVLNICKSVMPDFRLAVVPFAFRSSVFLGAPRYYYCYDYAKDAQGVVFEKRKPFQQFHLYNSSQDIIGNGITATTRDMKTAALGMYQVSSMFNIERQQTVGPLWADYDIYPESQKTMIVDTSLIGKGQPFMNFVLGGITNDLLDGFADENNSHEKIAWRCTASALRESVQDMYCGDLILYGDPSVKPHDRFYIDDPYSGINGQALVKEVVHHMSAHNGFITTISPDVIAAVDNTHDLMVHEAATRIGGLGATCAHIASYTAIALAGQTVASKLLNKAGEAATYGPWATRLSAAKNYVSKGLKMLKLGSLVELGGALALGTTALTASLPATMALTAASFMIGPYINLLLERTLKNLKVITIFPLKRYGHVYIAGFEGAKGSVYGSPSYNDTGIIGDAIKWIDSSPIASTLGEFFFSDEVKALMNKYRRDNDVIDANGTPTQKEAAYGVMMKHAIGDDKSYSQDYRAQMIRPRATSSNPKDVLTSYNYYKVLDVDNFRDSPKMKNFKLISADSRIQPYIEEEFFVILHEYPALNAGISVTEEDLVLNDGQHYRVKAIHCHDDENNYVLDVPLLHIEAINILYEILRITKNNMPAANSSDEYEDREITGKSFLVLKSALRIGDRTSRAAAGFTFILQPTDDAYVKTALKKALETLTAQFADSDIQDIPGIETEIFQYNESSDGEVAIVVNMPIVSEAETNNKVEDKTEDGK